MILSNRTLNGFLNGCIFNGWSKRLRSKVHTKTSNPGRSSNQPTKVKVKVKMTKSASHHLMLSIRPKSQAGRCAKHSFNQRSKLHVEAQSSKLNACSINVVSLSKINHCVELKFQVQSDKSQTSNLIQKHAPSPLTPMLSGGGRRRSKGASPSTTPSSPPSRKAWG